MSKIKLSDFIAKRLKEIYGIKRVFMVSGGGAMHLNDSFGKYIPYTCNHHEQGCAIAAEGYARVNQQLAVVNVTTGPGGLNCLNGVFGQWTDSVPVLYVSGQVKRQTILDSCPDIPLRQLGDQEVDIISVVKPLVKYAVRVNNPNDIKYHLDRAVYEATTGRFGPVWLDIPIDVQAAIIDEDELREFTDFEQNCHLSLMERTGVRVSEILDKLKSAKRPLIVAGHGIRLAGMKEEFLKLVEKLNIPVVTTMNGFDIIPDDNPNFIARIGTVANRAGNFALQNADVILFLGTRNNIRQISYNYENYAKNAFKIVVDIDKAELDKPTFIPDIKIHADLKDFIPAISKEVSGMTSCADWINFCQNLKKKYPPLSEAQRVGHNPIEPYYFIQKLTEHFSNDEIVIGSNGSAFLIPFQVGKVKKNQRYIWNSGNASMGYGLPAAIGACYSSNSSRVICLEGDGSIMMNLQELQTVVHNNLPIKLFVLNNGGYISIQQTQNNFFEGRMTACTENSGVSIPDYIKIGNAFGLKTIEINSLDGIDEKIDEVLNSEGAILCEVKLSPNYIFAPKLSAKKLADGTMISPSLEDMYPFLERNEFEENILK